MDADLRTSLGVELFDLSPIPAVAENDDNIFAGKQLLTVTLVKDTKAMADACAAAPICNQLGNAGYG